ncbi:hypothetical protein [Thermofilum sp.]|uniref:hypothetical protein n=1 Tax=Thermofilum sp. TaxID=1961369 RepID=UPI00315F7858
MLEKDDFLKWVNASHYMFEIFEGRNDAYPLAKKWIREWSDFGKFIIDERDNGIVNLLIKSFDYDVFRNSNDKIERNDDEWTKFVNEVDRQFKKLIENNLKAGECKNVGFAVAPFLFTWNFQRFKEYFKKRKEDFDIGSYFKDLGNFLSGKKEVLRGFKDKHLIYDEIEKERVKQIFDEINGKLKETGIGNNEPIGTIKLLHVFAPCYFPMIDNDIAKTIGGLLPSKWESLTSDSYLKWMNALKSWLQNYFEVINRLEEEYDSSILKLIDEGLYMMSTVKQRARVARLGIELN